jgi:rubrerythrin
LVVGRPVFVEPGAEEAEAIEWRRRERGIEKVLAGGVADVDRVCPECGYPVAGFRKSCQVCRHVVGRDL